RRPEPSGSDEALHCHGCRRRRRSDRHRCSRRLCAAWRIWSPRFVLVRFASLGIRKGTLPPLRASGITRPPQSRAPSIAYCAAHVGGVRRIRAIRLAESGGPMHQRKLDRKRRRLLAEGATRPLAPHSAMWLDGPVAGPHDSIVKAFFANTEDAASALASALPNAIAERIDWSSLRHANLNLVDRKLRAYFSDIVFTARIQEHEVILYVLLEHQSTNDPLMPFGVR